MHSLTLWMCIRGHESLNVHRVYYWREEKKWMQLFRISCYLIYVIFVILLLCSNEVIPHNMNVSRKLSGETRIRAFDFFCSVFFFFKSNVNKWWTTECQRNKNLIQKCHMKRFLKLFLPPARSSIQISVKFVFYYWLVFLVFVGVAYSIFEFKFAWILLNSGQIWIFFFFNPNVQKNDEKWFNS